MEEIEDTQTVETSRPFKPREGRGYGPDCSCSPEQIERQNRIRLESFLGNRVEDSFHENSCLRHDFAARLVRDLPRSVSVRRMILAHPVKQQTSNMGVLTAK